MNHGPLRQSTASQSRMVGPFIDDTDFKTVETGLTIANTDVKLSKNGAAGVNKNSGGGTHRNNGMYSITIDATDSNTIGELAGSILVTGALVVPFKFTVLAPVVYDALYGTTPTLLTSKDIGQIYEAAVVTVNTATSFDLDQTIASDNAWIGMTVSIEDVSTGEIEVRWVADVDQANDRIIISSAPNFTIAVGDIFRVETRQHPYYALTIYDGPTRGESVADRDIITTQMVVHAQIALRSDAAIVTDRAAEIALINANEGSGAGDYLNTNDSAEAQSDRTPALSGGGYVISDIQSVDGTAINGEVPANIKKVNDIEVTGDGESGTEWNPI